MRRWIVIVILVFVILLVWWRRPPKSPREVAYVGERAATLWSSTAQVREPVATVRYGEQVGVLRRRGEQAEVRAPQGARGWVDARLLIEPSLWQRRTQLLEKARAIPVQARGHTKVTSNVRVEPGRASPRLYQFGRGVPVEVLARAAAQWSTSTEEGPVGRESPGEEQKPRLEDWLLVRGEAASGVAPGEGESVVAIGEPPGRAGKADESIPIVGWVLGRFIELDLPEPVRTYASSSGMRVVAWFELNRVPGVSGEKPQYLAVGVRGGEGQPCDFTLVRVYTWGARRRQYETAYIESDLCGRLPVRVSRTASGDSEFRFRALGRSGEEERVYRMRQTVVRRVREAVRR
jgi:hypothetical protein